MDQDWLTTPEAQQLSGLHKSQLSRLCQRGVLQSQKRGRDWFILRSSLLDHLKEWHPDIFERITKRADE